MKVKCIAIGNRIMGDDAIGIMVLEKISSQIIKEDIEVIFAETDNEYALSKIEDGDFVYILDSTYYGLEPGTVTFTTIEDLSFSQNHTSQHQPNLIHIIRLYNINIKGFVIGIEIDKIQFSTELSDTLKLKFDSICEKVFKFIKLKY